MSPRRCSMLLFALLGLLTAAQAQESCKVPGCLACVEGEDGRACDPLQCKGPEFEYNAETGLCDCSYGYGTFLAGRRDVLAPFRNLFNIQIPGFCPLTPEKLSSLTPLLPRNKCKKCPGVFVGKGGDICDASCLEGFGNTLILNVNSTLLLEAFNLTALEALVELPVCLPYPFGVQAAEELTSALSGTNIPIIRRISVEYIGCASYQPAEAGVIGLAFNVVGFTNGITSSTATQFSTRVGTAAGLCRSDRSRAACTSLVGTIKTGLLKVVQAATTATNQAAQQPAPVDSEQQDSPLVDELMAEKTEEAAAEGAVPAAEGEGGRRLQEHGRQLQQDIDIGVVLQAIVGIQLRKGETRCFLDTACSDLYPAVSLEAIPFLPTQSLTNTYHVSGYVRNLPMPTNSNTTFAIIDVPPAGSPRSIGNGALKLAVEGSSSSRAQIEGTMYGGPHCPILSASFSGLPFNGRGTYTKEAFLGYLADLTSISLQLHPSFKGTFSLIIRVADNGPPDTPYTFNTVSGIAQVTDLVWTLSSQAFDPTLNAWNELTNMQNGNWGFLRRNCGNTSASGLPSRCNDLDTNVGATRCSIVTLFEPANATLSSFFTNTYSFQTGSSTCRTFTLSEQARVVAVLLDVAGINSQAQTYYADNLRLNFRRTSFPTTGVPPKFFSNLKTVNYRTNFERYSKVTLAADLPGPNNNYNPGLPGNFGR